MCAVLVGITEAEIVEEGTPKREREPQRGNPKEGNPKREPQRRNPKGGTPKEEPQRGNPRGGGMRGEETGRAGPDCLIFLGNRCGGTIEQNNNCCTISTP